MSQLSDFNFKNGIIGQAIQGWGYKTGLIKRLQTLTRKHRFHIGVPRGVTGELAKDYNQTMKLFSRLTPEQQSNFVKTLQTFYNKFPNATPQLKVEYVASLMHHFLKGGQEFKNGKIFPEEEYNDFPWYDNQNSKKIKKLGNKYVYYREVQFDGYLKKPKSKAISFLEDISDQLSEELRSHGRKSPYKRISPKEAKAVQADEKVKATTKSNSESSYPQKYTINLGDTLSKLAKRFNTTVEQLAADNNIENINKIIAGKTLIINKASLKLSKKLAPKKSASKAPSWEDAKKYYIQQNADVDPDAIVEAAAKEAAAKEVQNAIESTYPIYSKQSWEDGIYPYPMPSIPKIFQEGGNLTYLLIHDKYQNIAKSYFTLAPTLSNLAKGLEAYLTSYLILTPPAEDTGIITGTAPVGGRGVVSGGKIWKGRGLTPKSVSVKNKTTNRTTGWRNQKSLTDLVKVKKPKAKPKVALITQETKMPNPQFIPWIHPSLRSNKTSYLNLVLINNGGLFGGGDFAGGGSGGDFGVDRGNTYRDNNFIGLVLPYEKRNFEQAYAEARRQGLDNFEFNGKTYSTAYDTSNDPERARKHKEAAQSRKEYGIIGLGKWEK